jgi:hypothetical protein
MALVDPEIDRVVSIAKAMRARCVTGFDVENERWQCGTLRVYMGISERDNRQIVYEFDRSRAEERPVTGPADVLRGCPMLPRCLPGWKVQENGGIDWS